MIICIFMFCCHLGTTVFILLFRFQQIRNDLCVLIHELIIFRELPCILHKPCDHGDHIGINCLTQTVIFCKTEQFIICIFTNRCIVIGYIHDGSCAGLFTELCSCYDFFRITASCREYADRIFCKFLRRSSHKFCCDHADRINRRRTVHPVFHRQGMCICTATADKEYIGISFFTDLVYCGFNLRS